MDLIDTKAIQRLITWLQSRSTARVYTIDRLLRECASTGPDCAPESFWRRGLWAEAVVAREYSTKNQFLFHRLRTPFGELDLGFLRENEIVAIEVKTMGAEGFVADRLGRRQKQRLLRSMQFLTAETGAPCAFHYALVDATGNVTVIEDGVLT